MKNSLLAFDSQANVFPWRSWTIRLHVRSNVWSPSFLKCLLPQSPAEFEHPIAVRRTGMILIDGAGSVIPFAHMVIAEGGVVLTLCHRENEIDLCKNLQGAYDDANEIMLHSIYVELFGQNSHHHYSRVPGNQ